MRALLTAALLLAGCSGRPASVDELTARIEYRACRARARSRPPDPLACFAEETAWMDACERIYGDARCAAAWRAVR